MSSFRLGVVGAVGAAIMVVAGSSPSFASTVYSFSVDGSDGHHGTGPWGTVEVTQSGADLLFDVELAPNFFVSRGNHYSLTFRLSDTLGTVTDITHDGSGTAAFTQVTGTSFSNPSFSGFNYAIDCSTSNGDPSTGANNCGQWLKFTVQNAGTLLGSGGDSSIFFAADIWDSVNAETGTVGATFLRENAPEPDPTPVPGAAFLMGTVLAGGASFGAWRRRRRGKNAS